MLTPLRESNDCRERLMFGLFRNVNFRQFLILGYFGDRTSCLETGMDLDMFRRIDTESNTVATDFQDGDLDVVGDNDLLVLLPTNNKHLKGSSSKKLLTLKNRNGRPKIQEEFFRFFW